MNETKKIFKTALLDTVPVMTGCVAPGFGAIMSANSFSPLFAAAMSLFVFAGTVVFLVQAAF